MKISELNSWKFDFTPLEGCLIKCPKCGIYSVHTDWKEGARYCEDCNDDHRTLICPVCEAEFDHVWGPTFKIFYSPESVLPDVNATRKLKHKLGIAENTSSENFVRQVTDKTNKHNYIVTYWDALKSFAILYLQIDVDDYRFYLKLKEMLENEKNT